MSEKQYGKPYAYAYVIYEVKTTWTGVDSAHSWQFWLDKDGSGLLLFSELDAACDCISVTQTKGRDTFCTPELVMLDASDIELQTLRNISAEINDFLAENGISVEKFEKKKALYIDLHMAGYSKDPKELIGEAKLPEGFAEAEPWELF